MKEEKYYFTTKTHKANKDIVRKLDNPKNAIKFKEVMMENIQQLINKGMPTAKAFSKAIVKASKSTCLEDDPAKPGWFADTCSILEPPMEAQNKASELLKEQPSGFNLLAFKKLQIDLKVTMVAKNRSYYNKAIVIVKTMQSRPCEAWVRM
jgi:hypothetical protein